MSDCLSDNELSALYADSGSPQHMTQWRHHMRICDNCAMQFVKLRLGSDRHFEQDDIESETGPLQSPIFTGLEPNVRIGDFVVERRLGSGGMGVVY